jgi:hypothetical protein
MGLKSTLDDTLPAVINIGGKFEQKNSWTAPKAPKMNSAVERKPFQRQPGLITILTVVQT